MRVHPVKVTLTILPPSLRIKELLDKNNRAPVCAASCEVSSEHTSRRRT